MNIENMAKGIICGIIAGTISTIIIDIVALVTLSAMGLSLQSFFALIGRCLLTLLGLTSAAEPVWQGIALHYSIAILTGLAVGLLTQRFRKLQFSSYRKGMLLSVILAQVEGNSLFYLMSIIIRIPQAELVFMYGMCFFLHLIWGVCLGLIIAYYQRHKSAGWLHQEYQKTTA